jgi:pantetheine-phosphate adenylyltransferase
MPPAQSANSAILLATIPSLDPPFFLSSIIQSAASTTRNRLTILLFSRLFNPPDAPLPGVSRTQHWNDVHRILTYVYVQATKVAQDLDKILMDIDVLLLGIDGNIPEDLGKHFDLVFRVAGGESLSSMLPCIN